MKSRRRVDVRAGQAKYEKDAAELFKKPPPTEEETGAALVKRRPAGGRRAVKPKEEDVEPLYRLSFGKRPREELYVPAALLPTPRRPAACCHAARRTAQLCHPAACCHVAILPAR